MESKQAGAARENKDGESNSERKKRERKERAKRAKAGEAAAQDDAATVSWQEHKARRMAKAKEEEEETEGASASSCLEPALEEVVGWLRRKGPHEWHDMGLAGGALAPFPELATWVRKSYNGGFKKFCKTSPSLVVNGSQVRLSEAAGGSRVLPPRKRPAPEASPREVDEEGPWRAESDFRVLEEAEPLLAPITQRYPGAVVTPELQPRRPPVVLRASLPSPAAASLLPLNPPQPALEPLGWDLPASSRAVLIVGETGSGKSELLRLLAQGAGLDGDLSTLEPVWDPTKPIVSHFGEDPEAGQAWLSWVGLNSIPAWCKPYRCRANPIRTPFHPISPPFHPLLGSSPPGWPIVQRRRGDFTTPTEQGSL